ncbi:leucine-rich repeat-containing protein 40-like isoform X1 [Vespa mandarinia]|uniref:leucine-rich repeat-containing protein 40-like isoform X1 n=1 Tax=Vespa mandarinia TaxID=7446 RepID=UPI00161CCA1C|nr:leucine-rich repeat-containing protein 40-like isoform X1 [Vespa mandarinia]
MSKSKKKFNHCAVFKQRTKNDDNAELSNSMILCARKTGQLNLSSRGLFTVPNRVWTINELTEDELKKLNFELDYDETEQRWWEQESLKKLDLSCNSLITIDAQIKNLNDLIELDLHSNLLQKLPMEIGNLTKMMTLDLSHNKLEVLPIQFYHLLELRNLNLKYNILKELDTGITDLIMLSHLDLSHNNLIELPIGMGYLVRLIFLDVSYNSLQNLPPDIMSMRALQTLIANSNELKELPSLSELKKVETIMFQNNKLIIFPDLSGCVALKELYLSENNIVDINMLHLEEVRQLKILTLGSNSIKAIPEGIIQLINLEYLDLSNNNISLIPVCIGIMPNLKKFSIEGNNVQNVRADIIRCGTSRILKHLQQSIDTANINVNDSVLSNTSTIAYPNKYMMKNTRMLSLAGHGLNELPIEVLEDANAAGVTLIDLSRNHMRELPEMLSVITTVTDLKLTSNNLTYLPEWIGEKYERLQALDLSKNHLLSLPSTIALFKYLRDIDISFNRFTELPEHIYEISTLETLMVNDNLIANIDVSSLKKLKRLAILNLANNNIDNVPAELGNLTNIRSLMLSGNCFKNPRQAILAKSTDEILAYLRNRIPQQS